MKMNKDAKQITVKDIMSKSVISVDASMTINDDGRRKSWICNSNGK